MRVQHVGLVVSDVERSRSFYRDALGLEEVPRPPNFTFAGAWFRFGEDEIHLLAEADTTGAAGLGDPGRGVAYGLATHLAFEVDDLAAACARLEENGSRSRGRPDASRRRRHAGLLPRPGRIRPRVLPVDERRPERRPSRGPVRD